MTPSHTFESRCLPGVAIWLFVLLSCLVADAGLNRTQTINLSAGWNAIYLEVEPTETDPDVLFADTPITKVSGYTPSASSSQFTTDPTVNVLGLSGWDTWLPESDPQAFVSSLHSIYGGRSYLIHSESAFTLQVAGQVEFLKTEWRADLFNLVGFSVDEQAPPTFAQFFAGSDAHSHNRIYRLVAGTWRQVTDPSSQTMRSGEAFWIFCDGASTWQGPYRALPATPYGLYLSGGSQSVSLHNETAHPIASQIEFIPGDAPVAPLSIPVLTIVDTAPQMLTQRFEIPVGGYVQDVPPLEAGKALAVPLEARISEMTTADASAVMKITSDMGTVIWVPVVCKRADLQDE